MSTVTTNFPTASVRRSHATRFGDGVIAGYIHALAASVSPDTSAAQAGPRPDELGGLGAAELVDAANETLRARAPHSEGRPRKSPCWSRGGRIDRVMRAQRQLEAR